MHKGLGHTLTCQMVVKCSEIREKKCSGSIVMDGKTPAEGQTTSNGVKSPPCLRANSLTAGIIYAAAASIEVD